MLGGGRGGRATPLALPRQQRARRGLTNGSHGHPIASGSAAGVRRAAGAPFSAAHIYPPAPRGPRPPSRGGGALLGTVARMVVRKEAWQVELLEEYYKRECLRWGEGGGDLDRRLGWWGGGVLGSSRPCRLFFLGVRSWQCNSSKCYAHQPLCASTPLRFAPPAAAPPIARRRPTPLTDPRRPPPKNVARASPSPHKRNTQATTNPRPRSTRRLPRRRRSRARSSRCCWCTKLLKTVISKHQQTFPPLTKPVHTYTTNKTQTKTKNTNTATEMVQGPPAPQPPKGRQPGGRRLRRRGRRL